MTSEFLAETLTSGEEPLGLELAKDEVVDLVRAEHRPSIPVPGLGEALGLPKCSDSGIAEPVVEVEPALADDVIPRLVPGAQGLVKEANVLHVVRELPVETDERSVERRVAEGASDFRTSLHFVPAVVVDVVEIVQRERDSVDTSQYLRATRVANIPCLEEHVDETLLVDGERQGLPVRPLRLLPVVRVVLLDLLPLALPEVPDFSAIHDEVRGLPLDFRMDTLTGQDVEAEPAVHEDVRGVDPAVEACDLAVGFLCHLAEVYAAELAGAGHRLEPRERVVRAEPRLVVIIDRLESVLRQLFRGDVHRRRHLGPGERFGGVRGELSRGRHLVDGAGLEPDRLVELHRGLNHVRRIEGAVERLVEVGVALVVHVPETVRLEVRVLGCARGLRHDEVAIRAVAVDSAALRLRSGVHRLEDVVDQALRGVLDESRRVRRRQASERRDKRVDDIDDECVILGVPAYCRPILASAEDERVEVLDRGLRDVAGADAYRGGDRGRENRGAHVRRGGCACAIGESDLPEALGPAFGPDLAGKLVHRAEEQVLRLLRIGDVDPVERGDLADRGHRAVLADRVVRDLLERREERDRILWSVLDAVPESKAYLAGKGEKPRVRAVHAIHRAHRVADGRDSRDDHELVSVTAVKHSVIEESRDVRSVDGILWHRDKVGDGGLVLRIWNGRRGLRDGLESHGDRGRLGFRDLVDWFWHLPAKVFPSRLNRLRKLRLPEIRRLLVRDLRVPSGEKHLRRTGILLERLADERVHQGNIGRPVRPGLLVR